MNERITPPVDLGTLVPAIDLTIITTVGGDRQIQMKTMFVQDTEEGVANALIDLLARLSDRQKAIAELPAMREKMAEHDQMMRRYSEDWERICKGAVARQTEFDVQIAAAKKTFEAAFDAEQAKHEGSGRHKPFDSKTNAVCRGKAADIAQIEEKKLKDKAAHEAEVTGNAINMQRHDDEGAKMKAKIAEKEAIAAGR